MVRPSAQRYAAARILTGDWLATLTHAIESLRGKVLALKSFDTLASERLALVTAYVVTKPRRKDRLPSPLTVAKEIGGFLGATEAQLVGAKLLGMAETYGFVVFIDDDNKRAGWNAAKRVSLSKEAEAQRAKIEARLLASPVPQPRPLPEPPTVEIPRIIPNRRDLEDATPPRPEGFAVAEALAPIQNTAWRVNPFMLETLRKIMPPREVAAIEQATYYAGAPFFYRCGFDWRGRIYQQGGKLTYTGGSDAARSLIEFARGESLSPDGHMWLAVHVATCAGERGSFKERYDWTQEHSEKVIQTARDPLGSRFEAAKEPYRFLAACRAWADVAANPQARVHLPVTSDATASMFQHYAWLLRDEALGARVNLAPVNVLETPSDFYVSLTEGTDYTRDEVKQLCWMLYGKAPRDARERAVQKLLKAQAKPAWELYLALRRAAKRETKAGRPLEWTLPDGFKVYQANRVELETGVTLYLHCWNGPWPLQASRKWRTPALDENEQAAGVAPNLIHSLDACLLRTIVREAGLDRWAVAHDSLGVHPNDGGKMRKAMVEAVDCIYGPDILSRLLDALRCDGVQHPAELPASMRGGWYTFS